MPPQNDVACDNGLYQPWPIGSIIAEFEPGPGF